MYEVWLLSSVQMLLRAWDMDEDNQFYFVSLTIRPENKKKRKKNNLILLTNTATHIVTIPHGWNPFFKWTELGFKTITWPKINITQ